MVDENGEEKKISDTDQDKKTGEFSQKNQQRAMRAAQRTARSNQRYGSTEEAVITNDQKKDPPLVHSSIPYSRRESKFSYPLPVIRLREFEKAAKASPKAVNFIIEDGQLKEDEGQNSSKNQETRETFIAAVQEEYKFCDIEPIIAEIREVTPIIHRQSYPPLGATDIRYYLDRLNAPSSSRVDIRGNETRLAATKNINDFSQWPALWEIKHDGSQYYATQPRERQLYGLEGSIERVLGRTASDRREHRLALTRMNQDVRTQRGFLTSDNFRQRFFTRWAFGQPMTAGAYQEWEKNSRDFFPFLSGILQDARRGLSRIFQQNSGHAYTEIPDEEASERGMTLSPFDPREPYQIAHIHGTYKKLE